MNSAIIGAGLMGRWHARAARRSGADIVAVVDSDEQAGRALAHTVGGKWLPDLDRLSRERVSAVHVCTPADYHSRDIARALDCGWHCLAEKPIAPSADVTRTLLAKAELARTVLCPSHQFLYQRGTRRVIQRLSAIGPLRHAIAVCCTAGSLTEETSTALAMDILPHPLSVLRRIVGDSFREMLWTAELAADGELRAFSENRGASFTIIISTHGRPTRNEMELVCERGSLYADFFHGFATEAPSTVSRRAKFVRPFAESTVRFISAAAGLGVRAMRRESAFPGLLELNRQFYSAIETGTGSPITPAETLDVAVARDAIIQASIKSS